MRTNIVAMGLAIGLLALVLLVRPSAETHTIERVDGATRIIERFDSNKELHGLTKVYENNTLSQTQLFEHGMLVEWIIYKPDGSVKQHFREGDDYNLHSVD